MDIKDIINKLDNFKIKKLNIDKKDILLNKNNNKLERGEFISNEIVDYIDKNLKYKYIINYKYKNKKIKVRYFSKKKIGNIKNLFEIVINRIIFMMDITDVYKNVNMYIYDTHFKKKLPCKCFNKCKKKLGVHDINTGYSWTNNIVIYRKEELLKLIIHEMIHLLDIDVKYEYGSNMKRKFMKSLCIESFNVLINESYVETWAIVIHMYISLLEQRKKSYINYKNYFKKTLLFNYKQVLKILIFYDIDNFDEIFKEGNSCNRIIEFKMNLFSYHILKLLNLFNINKFINKFSAKDKNSILNKSYDFDDYVKYLEKNIKSMGSIINKKLKEYKNIKYNLSLKMSLN